MSKHSNNRKLPNYQGNRFATESKLLLCLAFILGVVAAGNCKAAANLPADVTSSAKFLFELGLPDPRGCEYRDFQTCVRFDEVSSNLVDAHGWILPARPKSNNRFAIAWNGAVYPVVRLGPKANLQSDVKALLQIERLSRKEAETDSLYGWPIWYQAIPERCSISQTNPTVLKVLFLARLGKMKWAREYWNGWCAVRTINEWPQERADHFYEFAYAWSATLFERAVCAHMDGNDGLAVSELRTLTRIRPELEREAARRGFKHPLGMDSVGQMIPAPYFNFLKPVPALLADEERRLKESPRETALQIGLDKFPNKSRRIAALISDLDQIALRPSFMDEFGGDSMNLHSTVEALVAEGNDAVEPLIECMKDDKRLTRSMDFTLSLDEVVTIYSVSNAAQTALDGILNMHFDTPAEYQAYWQKYNSLPQTVRWYQALTDDRAGRKEWMQAADNILSRTDGKYTCLWANAPAPNATNGYSYVAGDLRSKASPSVAELLGKRALEIAPTNYLSSEDAWAFDDATRLALMLVEWDSKSAAPVLKKLIPHCPVFYVYRSEDWDPSDSEKDLATLAVALAQLGEDSGLDIYSKWLANQSFDKIKDALPKVLSPLGQFPNYPRIREVSAELFHQGKVDWLDAATPNHDLLQTSLVRNEAFRSLVLESLTNNAKCGTMIFRHGGQFEIKDQLQDESFGGDLHPDSFAPNIGVPLPIRVCDDVAWRLSRVKNLPHFELYWPQAMRDAAIAAIIQFLDDNGGHLQLKPPPWPEDD